jgi:hypothetical protein
MPAVLSQSVASDDAQNYAQAEVVQVRNVSHTEEEGKRSQPTNPSDKEVLDATFRTRAGSESDSDSRIRTYDLVVNSHPLYR